MDRPAYCGYALSPDDVDRTNDGRLIEFSHETDLRIVRGDATGDKHSGVRRRVICNSFVSSPGFGLQLSHKILVIAGDNLNPPGLQLRDFGPLDSFNDIPHLHTAATALSKSVDMTSIRRRCISHLKYYPNTISHTH